jgi:vacuolar-type H+-ATPase subunit B/Vma2
MGGVDQLCAFYARWRELRRLEAIVGEVEAGEVDGKSPAVGGDPLPPPDPP